MSNLIMVFDVETTGLLPKRDVISKDISSCPYILQLSFIVYDVTTKKTMRIFDSYVNIDDSIVVSKKITEITGIVKDTCKAIGNPIEEIMTEFYKEYMKCNTIIAHNINFDKEMIMIEIIRNNKKMIELGCEVPSLLFNNTFNHIENKKLYCTMLSGTKQCEILKESIDKKRVYKKIPKLSELYFKLFDVIPDGLHNSLVDTKVCLRCYLQMEENFDIEKID
jgi:DNA polymerase III alpha subunit (gram-positive type)